MNQPLGFVNKDVGLAGPKAEVQFIDIK